MARYNGHEGQITAGGTALGEVESFELEISTNVQAANVMGSAWTDNEGGQKSASLSISVLTDPADPGQVATAGAGDTVAVVVYPTGNTTALKSFSGDFLVTTVGRSTSVGDLVKTSYSLVNKGAVTEATIS